MSVLMIMIIVIIVNLFLELLLGGLVKMGAWR